jgi:2-polyprenyl-3-methyl-5-hydroxy-6-metoxy-1,4-benzoquinol methylase
MKSLIRKIRRKLINNSKPLPKYFVIASLLESNKNVLDFGCWKGDLSRILIQEKNSNVTGCDLIKSSGFKHKNFEYVQVNKKNNFPFKEKFDYIVFADVLEHLENPHETLEETFKHTNKIIISIPNLNFFLYKLFPKLENPPIELTPHLHHWTLNSFKKILPENTKITKAKYCTDFPEFRWANYFPFKNKSFFNQTLIIKCELTSQ